MYTRRNSTPRWLLWGFVLSVLVLSGVGAPPLAGAAVVALGWWLVIGMRRRLVVAEAEMFLREADPE